MDIIKIMRESENDLLKAEANDLKLWSKLTHNKESLECFLNFNLAQIQFKNKKNLQQKIICTSNTTLIKIFLAKTLKEKNKLLFLKSNGIHSNDTTSINTWDLIDNHIKTINLSSWKILNFITINKNNILLLDTTFKKILNKIK